MDKKTIFIKTDKGKMEAAELSGDLKRVLSLVDNKSTVDELSRHAPPSLRDGLRDVLEELVAGEYIRDKDKSLVEPKIATPKITPPKMFVPKPVAPAPSEELDFTSITRAAPASNTAELAAKQKAEEAARGRAELEAAVAAAKAKASAEAEAKASAKAKQEAEIAARARAEAEARAKQEAMIREQAEAKAKQESAARMKAEQETARARAALEAASKARADAEARVRAEIEAAARARQVAEAKAKQEAEAARVKAEQETARIKAELEAAAKAKAEAEAARVKAEQEAERVRAELAAAKARAEAEAKALAAAHAKQAAEEKARQEAEAARLRAEQAEAARAKAEAEAKAQREAEERARHEAESARLKAEQEVARLKAQQEAEEKIRTVAAAKHEAEEQAKRAEREAQRIAEKERVSSETPAAFEINLNSFLGAEANPVTRTAHRDVDPAARERAEAEAKAAREAEQRAAADAKADADRKSKENTIAEMARMKAEAEAARQMAEEEARRKAEEQVLAEEQGNAWAEAEQRAQAQAKIEAEQATQQAALSQAKAAQKSVPRARGAPFPLAKITFSLIALALVALVVLPYVYPLQEYIAPLEQRLSAQLKQPVRIVGMSAASLPPKLQLQGITVGSAKEVTVGSVVLNFDFLSLLSEIKVISNAELQDVSIDGRLLDKQMLSLKSLGGDTQYPIRNLTLQRVKIVSDEVALPVFSGIADIDAQGGFSRVSLHSSDDKYSIDLQPKQGRWQLGLSLKETSLPLLPGIVFSDLNAKGDLGDGEVNFTEIDGHLYNGILLGSAKLNWRKDWQLQGRLEAKTFELNKMFPRYGVAGELFGEGTFTLTGTKLSQLGDAPRLDASFSVKNGVVSGIDMVETARLGSRENLAGGRTHFENMIGLVQLENHAIHFRQLKVVSGMLSANGSFDVFPDKRLSGDFNAEIKLRAGNNQLTLFGLLGETKLRAGR